MPASRCRQQFCFPGYRIGTWCGTKPSTLSRTTCRFMSVAPAAGTGTTHHDKITCAISYCDPVSSSRAKRTRKYVRHTVWRKQIHKALSHPLTPICSERSNQKRHSKSVTSSTNITQTKNRAINTRTFIRSFTTKSINTATESYAMVRIIRSSNEGYSQQHTYPAHRAEVHKHTFTQLQLSPTFLSLSLLSCPRLSSLPN
jgi:hypothetical protein